MWALNEIIIIIIIMKTNKPANTQCVTVLLLGGDLSMLRANKLHVKRRGTFEGIKRTMYKHRKQEAKLAWCSPDLRRGGG